MSPKNQPTSSSSSPLHDKNIFAHNHASRFLVGKLKIESETEFSERLNQFVKILVIESCKWA